MAFKIVLIEPEIPNNTGNIGRLALGSGCELHLVKPFGFQIDDKKLKRAGLDYWQHLDLNIYENIEEFFAQTHGEKKVFLSSHGSQNYTDVDFQKDLYIVFGKESVGLPKYVIEENADQLFKIPIHSPHIRSLNLGNAVGIVVYEGLRQLNS